MHQQNSWSWDCWWLRALRVKIEDSCIEPSICGKCWSNSRMMSMGQPLQSHPLVVEYEAMRMGDYAIIWAQECTLPTCSYSIFYWLYWFTYYNLLTCINLSICQTWIQKRHFYKAPKGHLQKPAGETRHAGCAGAHASVASLDEKRQGKTFSEIGCPVQFLCGVWLPSGTYW